MSGDLMQSDVAPVDGPRATEGRRIDTALLPTYLRPDCILAIQLLSVYVPQDLWPELLLVIEAAATNPKDNRIWQQELRIFKSIRIFAKRMVPKEFGQSFAAGEARMAWLCVRDYCDAEILKIEAMCNNYGEPEHWAPNPGDSESAVSAFMEDCFRDYFELSEDQLAALAPIPKGLPTAHVWRLNQASSSADTAGAALAAIADELDQLGYRFKAGLARRAAVKLVLPTRTPPSLRNKSTEAGRSGTVNVSGSGTAGSSAPRLSYRRASDVQARPIRWLWPGRIARGKVSMLAGNPGLGKSQVSLSMAAIVSRGGIWPVDRARCEAGNVVILSAEDDAADTIRPRLEAAGADLNRIFILDAVVEAYRADGGEILRAFNLKIDLSRLAEMLDGIGDVALIVIDPVTAYLGETDSHKNAEIRALLSPLSDIAAKHGAAVVCVSHLNKAQGGEALMRVTGSLAFVAAARSAWLVHKDPEDDSRRFFLPLKNNIGNDQSGLAFSLQAKQVPSAAGIVETSSVAWEADAVTVTADQAMAMQGDPEEKTALDDARGFLVSLLADGPVSAGQIRKDAEGAGFNWRTVQRAADRLGLERQKAGMRGGWTWKLPPKATTNPEGDK